MGSCRAVRREGVRCGFHGEREVASSLGCLESFVGWEGDYSMKLLSY